jgi:ABC-2 type transport system permease protein
MQKYWLVFWLTIKEYFVYRINFILWRLRVFLNFLVTFFLWTSVFDATFRFGSYNKPQLLSYIFFANIISNFVLGTRTVDIAGDIINGTIMNYLLKPINFFHYYLTRDLADKLLNLFFVVFEVWLLIFLFHPPIFFPHSLIFVFWFLIFLTIGTLIGFYINLSISFLGFWSNEVWAPRFLFMTVVFLLSGSYFPLDLLPSTIYFLFLLTPFPYLFYLPTQILLGRLNLINPTVIIASFFWLVFSWRFAHQLWLKGNKNYNFFGR